MLMFLPGTINISPLLGGDWCVTVLVLHWPSSVDFVAVSWAGFTDIPFSATRCRLSLVAAVGSEWSCICCHTHTLTNIYVKILPGLLQNVDMCFLRGLSSDCFFFSRLETVLIWVQFSGPIPQRVTKHRMTNGRAAELLSCSENHSDSLQIPVQQSEDSLCSQSQSV